MISCNNCNDFENLNYKIELKKKLILPSNKPNINSIKKVTVTVDILGNKVISTSLNEIIKKQNLNLAKERLLIVGWICTKIYYTSSKGCCINTAFFKVPFNTYIPLNKSADCCKDKFIINSCVKNICITPYNCRSFTEKFNLLLFAKKIYSIASNPVTSNEFIIPPEPLLPAELIIPSDVESLWPAAPIIPSETEPSWPTDPIIPSEPEPLLPTDPITPSEPELLWPTDPIIPSEPEPSLPTDPIIPSEPEPLWPSILPIPESTITSPTENFTNTIIINNNYLLEIAKIEFDYREKKLLVTSKNMVADDSLGSDSYFSLVLKQSNGTIRNSSFIISNKTADNFVITLNNTHFDYGDILELDYLLPYRFLITNVSDLNENHIPNVQQETYIITENGLVVDDSTI